MAANLVALMGRLKVSWLVEKMVDLKDDALAVYWVLKLALLLVVGWDLRQIDDQSL